MPASGAGRWPFSDIYIAAPAEPPMKLGTAAQAPIVVTTGLVPVAREHRP